MGTRASRLGRGEGPATGRPLRAKPNFVEPARELARKRRARLDADLGCRLCDLVDDSVADDRSTGRLFERCRIVLGHAVDVVLTVDVRQGRIAHRPLRHLARCHQLKCGCERRNLVLVNRDLQRDVVRQLREPAEIADDQRSPERQRADRTAGRLAHRRSTERDARVAGSHQRPEPLLLDVVDPLDAVTGEAARHRSAATPARRAGASRSDAARARPRTPR